MKSVLAIAPLTAARRRWLTGRSIDDRLRVASAVLLGVFVVIVGVIVLSPGRPAAAGQNALRDWLSVWRLFGIQPTFLSAGLIEWWSNVVMFLPLGLLAAAVVRPRQRLWVAPVAVGVSTAIECAQSFLPNRVPSVYDVLANSLGALIGVILLAEATRVISDRSGFKRR